MELFETHAHLDFKDFNPDRDTLIRECYQQGITKIINIGIDIETTKKSIELAEKYDFIYATGGFHPHDAEKYDEEALKILLSNKKIVAIGEIGLDFYRNLSPKKIQIAVFEKQLALAKELNLPVIVHDREAHDECYSILKSFQPLDVVFHCFSGDEIFLEKIMQENWHVSFTGTISYKNSQQTNAVRLVLPERYFIETDSPYLSPVPLRGKRNSPLYLHYIVEKIAEIRRIPPKLVAKQTYENAMHFFRVK
jgi:TatD DNase family protein